MRSIVSSSLSLLLVLALSGCTRIETGEAGLRVDFSGTIQPTVVPPGIHQTLIGHIILFAAKEILRMRVRINEILVQHTGQDAKWIQDDTERDYIMSAEQGKEYGIIDDVIRKRV